MSRYTILSDFHWEFRKGQEKKFWEAFEAATGDLRTKTIIIAGDYTALGLPEATFVAQFQGVCERFENVIYVPGNHEYYGTCVEEAEIKLEKLEAAFSNLKRLVAGRPLTIDGQRFIGDTMWFPDRPEVHIHRRLISDSWQIKGLFPWCFTNSSLFINYLQQELKEDDIVISHHVPTDIDTDPRWKTQPTQPYFLNADAERFLANPNNVKPKAWIYGHTHDKHDYMAFETTRFICNPIGYPGENGHVPDSLGPIVYEI